MVPAGAENVAVLPGSCPPPQASRVVALIDPTPAYRKGLAVALQEAGFGTEEEPSSLVEWLRSTAAPLILVTIRDEAGWDVVPPDVIAGGVPTVALLPAPSPAAYSSALRHGATGVAPWDAPPDYIVRVLRDASEGLTVLPRDVALSLASKDCSSSVPEWVTPTTVDCLRGLAGGMTVAALARQSGCSERAMYRRLQCLYGRMGVASRSEAIAQASRWGLI